MLFTAENAKSAESMHGKHGQTPCSDLLKNKNSRVFLRALCALCGETIRINLSKYAKQDTDKPQKPPPA